MYIILFHINQSNDKNLFVLTVYDNSSPLLACIFVMDLPLNSYCSAVSRYKVYRTYTNKLISITNVFFPSVNTLVGENQAFRETSFRNWCQKTITRLQSEAIIKQSELNINLSSKNVTTFLTWTSTSWTVCLFPLKNSGNNRCIVALEKKKVQNTAFDTERLWQTGSRELAGWAGVV